MIEDQIIAEHKAKLERELENFRIQLELERTKLEEDLKRKKEETLRSYEREIIEQNENALRTLKNQLERDLNHRKRTFLEEQIEDLLNYMNQRHSNDLKDIISKLDYEHIIVPGNIDIPGAERSRELKYGFIYRPKGKRYYINMDMRRIIDKHLQSIVDHV
ncbi:MAG: hypothetical protein NZ908_01565 [Candidatus Micrarchaeota archaeon]|nr:hypothetical protein [Candidatus Micrarchaeota archaeon]MCX8154385.1 hypothetical protein [Candidatus Micrarchaeota archaeon]